MTSEIIPLVVREAGTLVGQELQNYTASVHEMIQDEVDKQHDILQKAFMDLRLQKEQEQVQQEQLKQQLTADLQQVRELLHDTVSAV